jgi:hypothetical protein
MDNRDVVHDAPPDSDQTEVRHDVAPAAGEPDVEHDVPRDDEPETFPREYVENLRKESAKYRDRAKDRDGVAHRLHTALVAATGRLQDPSDLPYADAHIEDPDQLDAAIDELLTRKPHLASHTPHGDIGQGVSQASDSVSLGALLRKGA